MIKNNKPTMMNTNIIIIYPKLTVADCVAPTSEMFVATFNLSPIFATALPCTNTFVDVAITFLGDVQGEGSLLQVLPDAGDIASCITTGANPLTLTVRAELAAQSIGVGGVTQGQLPPDSTPPL